MHCDRVSAEAYDRAYETLLKSEKVDAGLHLDMDRSVGFELIQALEEHGYAERLEGRQYDVSDFGTSEHIEFMDSEGLLFNEVSEQEKPVLEELTEAILEGDGETIDEVREAVNLDYSDVKEKVNNLRRKSLLVSNPGSIYEADPLNPF